MEASLRRGNALSWAQRPNVVFINLRVCRFHVLMSPFGAHCNVALVAMQAGFTTARELPVPVGCCVLNRLFSPPT